MIFALALAATLAAPAASATPAALLAPDVVLARYAKALAAVKEPSVLSLEYRLEQTGGRSLDQTHRIYRTTTLERDETLSVDAKRLTPPTVRIYRGKRNRYTVAALAPRPDQYDYTYLGPRKDAHHVDYVFRLTPKAARAFAITELAIDGIKFLPRRVVFRTSTNGGSGAVQFAGTGRWWIPLNAIAQAKLGRQMYAERLTFGAYRFPTSLPSSTFSVPKPLPTTTIP